MMSECDMINNKKLLRILYNEIYDTKKKLLKRLYDTGVTSIWLNDYKLAHRSKNYIGLIRQNKMCALMCIKKISRQLSIDINNDPNFTIQVEKVMSEQINNIFEAKEAKLRKYIKKIEYAIAYCKKYLKIIGELLVTQNNWLFCTEYAKLDCYCVPLPYSNIDKNIIHPIALSVDNNSIGIDIRISDGTIGKSEDFIYTYNKINPSSIFSGNM